MLDARTADRERALARFRLVALWIPLALTAIIVVVQLVLLPQLPDQVASHWSATGRPDGWSPGWTYPLMTALICGGLIAFMAIAVFAGRSSSSGSLDLRFVSAINLWTVGFLGSLMLLLVVSQVGLEDASDVSMPLWTVLPSLALGFALGAIGWFLTPRVKGDDLDATAPDAVALRPGEQAVWLRTATIARSAMAIMVGVLLTSVAAVVIAVLVSDDSATIWILGLTMLVVGAGTLATMVFRVRVDATGFTARSAVGWPGIHIATSGIKSVEEVQVNPMGDFGGWGWRFSPSLGQGIVLRSGDALRITRTNGKKFTVTVDDAATAAALLRGYMERNPA